MSSNETLQATSDSDPSSKWDSYDRTLEQNSREIEDLKNEHDKKNWLSRRLGRRGLERRTSQLGIEIGHAFIDTLTKGDSALTAQKDQLDTLRATHHEQ